MSFICGRQIGGSSAKIIPAMRKLLRIEFGFVVRADIANVVGGLKAQKEEPVEPFDLDTVTTLPEGMHT